MNTQKKTKSLDGGHAEIHISGAEGIFGDDDVPKMGEIFIRRALSHPRGRPDKIIVTIEEIKGIPLRAPLLQITTLECMCPADAWQLIADRISVVGISSKALRAARRMLEAKKTMRGAALISLESGQRMEPDRLRGVRVSRLGIDKVADGLLSRSLRKSGINTQTVKEALVLASKVAACKGIAAEICISDDPHYTTGYIASRSFGYLRIPNIKKSGDMRGGRVFFLEENTSAKSIIAWLERKPVIVG